MFAAGDLVVYGGEGVCRVESIGPSGLAYDDGTRLYYHLTPLYRSGTVMTPVDTGVLMRSVITREEALALIAAIPSLPPCKPEQPGIRAAKDFYHQVVMRCQCGELAYYLTSVGNFAVLTPLAMVVFLLLWLLPTLLIAGLVRHF